MERADAEGVGRYDRCEGRRVLRGLGRRLYAVDSSLPSLSPLLHLYPHRSLPATLGQLSSQHRNLEAVFATALVHGRHHATHVCAARCLFTLHCCMLLVASRALHRVHGTLHAACCTLFAACCMRRGLVVSAARRLCLAALPTGEARASITSPQRAFNFRFVPIRSGTVPRMGPPRQAHKGAAVRQTTRIIPTAAAAATTRT